MIFSNKSAVRAVGGNTYTTAGGGAWFAACGVPLCRAWAAFAGGICGRPLRMVGARAAAELTVVGMLGEERPGPRYPDQAHVASAPLDSFQADRLIRAPEHRRRPGGHRARALVETNSGTVDEVGQHYGFRGRDSRRYNYDSATRPIHVCQGEALPHLTLIHPSAWRDCLKKRGAGR
jgi:hypothetical protein